MRISSSRTFFVSALLLILSAPALRAQQAILPMHGRPSYSSSAREQFWSAPVKSPDGKTVYILSLVPDYGPYHHLLTIELRLSRPDDAPGSANLLDPSGKLLELQAYHFNARDFSHGIAKSAFGPVRTFTLPSLGLLVRCKLSRAVVGPTPEGRFEWKELQARISAQPLPKS